MTIYNVASRLWRHFIRPNGYFSFHEKLKSIQYNAALPITGAIRGSFKKKIYQEQGFEFLQQRRWYRKLCLFFKINKQSPRYLFELIPTARKA